MKKLIGLGIAVIIIVMMFVLRAAYLADKQREQLLYAACRENGCAEAACQLFATSTEAVQVDCGNGHYVKKW